MRLHQYLLIFTLIALINVPSFSQKKGKGTKDVLSEEYYAQLGSNLERLHKLRLGIFVQYNQDSLGVLNGWKFNDGEDSVLLYTIPVGNVNKDGYWVYHHQFISNMPDMPLYTAFEHIVPVTRDSFVGHFYESTLDLSLDDLLDKKHAFDDVQFNELIEMKEKVYYWKKDFTEFHAFSAPYFQNDKNREIDRYTIDFYKITAANIRFNSTGSKGLVSLDVIRKHFPKDERFTTFLVRFDPQNVSLFADGNRKKGKN